MVFKNYLFLNVFIHFISFLLLALFFVQIGCDRGTDCLTPGCPTAGHSDIWSKFYRTSFCATI